MGIIFNLLPMVLIAVLSITAYQTFRNHYYILLIFFLLLGASYSLQDEMIFGYINLGVHVVKVLPGLTLYSKDIILILGLAYIALTKKNRNLHSELFFKDVPFLFIFLVGFIFIIRVVFDQGNLDLSSVKNILRWYSPILLYYIVFYLYRENQYKKIIILLMIILLLTVIPFITGILGFSTTPASSKEMMISFGSVNIERFQIPHAFALMLPFFFAIGVLATKYRSNAIRILSIITIPLFMIALILSTYRSVTYIGILGLILGLYMGFRKNKKASTIFAFAFFGLILILTVSQLSAALKFNFGQIAFLRFLSGFEEVFQQTGTGGVRILIIQGMIEKIDFFTAIAGRLFSKELFTDIYGANSDIGIIATIVQGGILVLIPIFIVYKKIFKLVALKFEDSELELVRVSVTCFFIAILPSMLFNFDFWFQMFLSQTIFFFMGLFDAIYFDKEIKNKAEVNGKQ